MQNNHLINLFVQNVVNLKMTYQTYIAYKNIKPNLKCPNAKISTISLLKNPNTKHTIALLGYDISSSVLLITLTKIINATLLFLPPFFMSWTQRSKTFSMYTKGLFLSNIVHKSV